VSPQTGVRFMPETGRASSMTQVIDGRDVDPLKLSDKLNKVFGKGNYKVEVRLGSLIRVIYTTRD
jgi:hypothetical protein